MNSTEALFALVRSGLYLTPAEVNLASEWEWKDVLTLAREQTVCGVVSTGISLLSEDTQIPDKIVFAFMTEADRIQRRNAEVNSALDSLKKEFSAAGLDPILMKGPSVAAYYPDPMLRESGDLDIYIPDNQWDASIDLAHSKGLEVSSLPDGSAHYTWEGVEIDQHRRYYDLSADATKLPPVPSVYAELVMLSSHILKHCMFSGVGLRQICDMAMAYKSLDYVPEVLEGYYQQLGLVRWNRLLSSFLAGHLGAENLPCSDKRVSTIPLDKIVLGGGNFGFYAKGRQEKLHASAFRRKVDTACRMICGLPFSLKYGGREAFSEISELIKGNL